MKWAALFVSVVFWMAVIFLAGLLMVLQGDCGAGTTPIEAAECSHNASTAGLVVVGLGAMLYVAAWRHIRKRW